VGYNAKEGTVSNSDSAANVEGTGIYVSDLIGRDESVISGQEIWTWYDLHAIRDNLGGSYLLMNDLDSTTAGYEELAAAIANGGKGWEPLALFEGSFDGNGHEISGLFINRPDEDDVGLFGRVQEGLIKNVGLVNVNVTGKQSVGALVGYSWKSTLDSDIRPPGSKTYSYGIVTGEENVGGLVGNNYDGTVNQCESSAEVYSKSWRAGGLVGLNGGTVENSSFTGSVAGVYQVGGLVGYNNGTVIDSDSSGSVTGDQEVGCLVGLNEGTVERSSCTGTVISPFCVS